MNAAQLATINMKQCARCHCALPIEDFYVRQGRLDSYCRKCRRFVNLPQDEDRLRVTYHHRDSLAIPTATRHCSHCGHWYGDFSVFWPTDANICTFCGGGK